ncbi:SOS response-associated peptidase [Pseudoxanthomonas japonensis]|jgi:putative SOS response-associated peptidase YedK|uniref:SOS response-associated peptidase n=1 Tax=Pseudoxanthomonas TaxID=83618 RepID=UPI001BCAEA56|nr:SOS response-associated peptidase family protein [Pseudoxanthomonas japonensis]
MRRFAQAIAQPDQLDGDLPQAIEHALVAGPDRYNVGKGKPAQVVAMAEGRMIVVADMVWGLVPRWSKTPFTRYTTVTARLERAPRSRIFADAWKQRHCLVPLSGYYKWDRQRKPPWPHFIQRTDGNALLAAGLWERWEGEEGVLHSFAILTAPNASIPAPLTPDGPIFLEGKAAMRWLSGSISTPRSLLRHGLVPTLESYTVSRAIAKPEVDDYTLLEPVMPDDTPLPEQDEDEVWEDD